MRRRAEAMRSKAERTKLAPADARNAFFYHTSNAMMNYAVSMGLIHTASHAQGQRTGDIVVDIVVRDLFGKPLLSFYMAKLRAHLFLEVWFGFEDALRILYDAVVPPEVREKDLAAERDKYKKPPKRVRLSIPFLWGRVSKLAEKPSRRSGRRRGRHREVVEFCAASRNTIHSNRIYDGSPRALKIGKRTIRLIPGAPTDFESIAVLPKLIDELAAAASYLRQGIRHAGFIKTPVTGRPSPYK
jgi:hypothetical protein